VLERFRHPQAGSGRSKRCFTPVMTESERQFPRRFALSLQLETRGFSRRTEICGLAASRTQSGAALSLFPTLFPAIAALSGILVLISLPLSSLRPNVESF
jgi:hypothetical protein